MSFLRNPTKIIYAQSETHPPAVAETRFHVNMMVPSMTRGGAERIVADIVEMLSGTGHTMDVFVCGEVADGYDLRSCRHATVHALASVPKSRRIAVAASRVLTTGSDVLFTHLIRIDELRRLWRLGVRTIPVIHNSRQAWQDDPRLYHDDMVPFVVAVADDVAAQLKAAGLEKPVKVVRHQIPTSRSPSFDAMARARLRATLGVSDGCLLVGMVGQFKVQKRYTMAVRALARLREARPDAKIVVLGGWDHRHGHGREAYDAATRLADQLGVRDGFLTLGSVDDVEPWYSAFDVFLNTSVFEGLSISTLESSLCGCPMVLSDAGGQREGLSPRDRLVSQDAGPESYAKAVLDVAERPRTRPHDIGGMSDIVGCVWAWLGNFGPSMRPARREGTLFVTANLNAGGAQRSLVNLASHMPEGYRRFVLVAGPTHCGRFLTTLEQASVPVAGLRDGAKRHERISSVLSLVDRLGVETVCFWNMDPMTKLAVSKALEGGPVKLVEVSPGPMLFDELDEDRLSQKVFAFTSKDYLRAVDHFVSKYSGGLPDDRYGSIGDKGVVIPNGVPLPDGRGLRNGVRPGFDPRLAVVTAGRIVPNKRVEWMLDMAEELGKMVPGATLTFVGGVEPRHVAYWDTIRTKAKDLDNVHFAGPDADVFTLLPSFRAFALSSFKQGCPNASLEAMACGLPVVANDDGGTREQILDGRNGFLVDGETPKEMAVKLAVILRDQEMADRMGAEARRLVSQRFSMQSMVEAYGRLFKSEE